MKEKSLINPVNEMKAGTKVAFEVVSTGEDNGITIDLQGNPADILMLLALGAGAAINGMAEGDEEEWQAMESFLRRAFDLCKRPAQAVMFDLGHE